ncbi:MAG: transposase family protein [Chloroflexi bacterium]|nr:transposase family protein [Chloroflexota bacterium]
MPDERIITLKKQLDLLSSRSPERKKMVQTFGELYGVSRNSVYRSLRKRGRPKALKRSDAGESRVLPTSEMERYCRVIAAIKLRTLNKKGHHISTVETIRLLETFGIETPEGSVKAPKGLLKTTTINRLLRNWGYDFHSLQVEPVAVRYQAKHSNDCWQFDLSPSDLKTLDQWPDWVDSRKGRPILMLYSVVDDRSGVAYQEYHVTYGEDVESALRFLFNAMSLKGIDGFPFQGRPKMLYMDNGPIAKSLIFQRVMDLLNINIQTHLPKGKDGRRTTARAKGKVERPFRTVKEVHETLYHFHQPKNREEANEWLMNFVLRYNEKPHRSAPRSRIEDWLSSLPVAGIRQMCVWERFCSFAREPERRKVGSDAIIKVDGGSYQIDHELAGHTVILLWGLFDKELFVEFKGKYFGPYQPSGGPVLLHRYRAYKKSKSEKRADAVEKLAANLYLPKEALAMDTRTGEALKRDLPKTTQFIKFEDPDPFQEFTYANMIQARKAISDYLGIPLAKLAQNEIEQIEQILSETLTKKDVMEKIRALFRPNFRRGRYVNRSDEAF